jgi:hypothetical protein
MKQAVEYSRALVVSLADFNRHPGIVFKPGLVQKHIFHQNSGTNPFFQGAKVGQRGRNGKKMALF